MLTTVSIALIAGVTCQVISIWLGIPSIIILLLSGVALGPEFLNLVNPGMFGQGFETLIKIFVALILFEAGLNLEKQEIKNHRFIILPLITVGAIITMLGAAFFAWFIIDLDWKQAFLFGSLVVVTGPTVIQPLMRKIHVRSDLKNILEHEGVFIDPIGVIGAIFVFEIVLQTHGSFFMDINFVFLRLGSGVAIGLIGGYLIGFLVNNLSNYLDENQDFFVLAFALGVYAVSELLLIESGLMAAVVSGIVVGNMDIPNKQVLKRFKGKISILFISLLFIMLTASVNLEYVYELGYKGVLVVIALMFVVRPLTVFISSMKSGLKINEKMFLSYISTRGIVAASIASLISIELKNKGFAGGELIQGLVFLTITITVIFQGLTAGPVAKLLGVKADAKKIVIVGANALGRLVGKLLVKNNLDICFIDTNDVLIQNARSLGFEAIEGNSLNISQLEKTGIDNAQSMIAVTTSDKVNLFVSKLSKIDFGIEEVLPVINKKRGRADIETVSRLKLNVAFGKPLNVFSINSNISRKNYVVISVQIDKSSNLDQLYSLFAKDHIVPLLYKNKKEDKIFIYRKGINLSKEGEIILVDFDPASNETDLEFIRDNKKKIIDV